MTTGTTTRREVEIDTKLAELWGEQSAIHDRLDSCKASLYHALGYKKERYGRSYSFPYKSLDTLIEEVTAKLANDEEASKPWSSLRYTKDTLARIVTYRVALAASHAAAKPFEDEYEAAPWSRFFLVQNTGGHIHSSMRCSTCFPTTRFGWLPDLSGLTEKDAVDEHGPLLCSVCYPSAPVEWTLGKQKDETDKCPGSGGDAKDWRRRYEECPVCGFYASVTKGSKLRTHKTKGK